ncbi:uncharacterized protein LOC112186872 [Rosa chinensis]|uniref:uncharacterized protein LOC112186872 n=1 Tax=Rosa chinensis TaxID=74649 RepID=UPI001AD8D106|nr:uncharacterized protein LOC112186872 [Rosa chinensis]
MDLVEVMSNLHALRQLYELLQNIEDDLQHINSKNVHQTLDLKARKLFRHLLDDATEKMFHTQSKTIEAESVVQTTPSSSKLEQPKPMPKLQSPLSPDAVNSSLNVVLSNEKDSKSSVITSKKDEQYPVKRQSAIFGSKVSTSSDVPQYKKKRCRACIAKEMKKQYSTKEATMSNERAEVPGKNSGDQDQQRDWGSGSVSCVDDQAKRLQESNSKTIERENSIGETLPSSVSLTTGAGKQEVGYIPIGQMKKKLDEGNDFAKVVTNAIREIEFCILALQLSSDLAHSAIDNDVDEHVPFKLGISVSPVEHRKEEEAVTRQELSHTHMGESLLGGAGTSQLSQKHGKFAESVSRGQGSPLENYMNRYESMSRSASQNNNKMASYINGLRVSPIPNEVNMKPPLQLKTLATPVQKSETSLVLNRIAKNGTSRYNSSTVSSVGGGLGRKSSQRTRIKNEKRYDQTMMKPVFLDLHSVASSANAMHSTR